MIEHSLTNRAGTSGRRRRRSARAATVLAVLCPILLAGAGPASASTVARVYVLNGLPGTNLAIAVDGHKVDSSAHATDVVGPLGVTAGKHTITFLSSNGSTLARATLDAQAGATSDVVVHRQVGATTTPEVTVFADDVTKAPSGQGRVTVAHVAAIGPADIRVNGKVIFANVANGEFSSVKVPSGTYQVDVVPTGTSGPGVLGPLPLTVKAGTLTRVYAIGDTSDNSMNAMAHVVALGAPASDPKMVESGTGGQAAAAGLTTGPVGSLDQRSGPGPEVWWTATGSAFLAAVALLLARRRIRLPARARSRE
ncbi:DUF4397 domain-containing protein [Angustibacter sp. McL0619]|uniref:DUF4397 domain-containing protein n=1 Tax=Angustibacter sp. McL0619 TaxID=3415676 RepID=UPI003CF8C950